MTWQRNEDWWNNSKGKKTTNLTRDYIAEQNRMKHGRTKNHNECYWRYAVTRLPVTPPMEFSRLSTHPESVISRSVGRLLRHSRLPWSRARVFCPPDESLKFTSVSDAKTIETENTVPHKQSRRDLTALCRQRGPLTLGNGLQTNTGF